LTTAFEVDATLDALGAHVPARFGGLALYQAAAAGAAPPRPTAVWRLTALPPSRERVAADVAKSPAPWWMTYARSVVAHAGGRMVTSARDAAMTSLPQRKRVRLDVDGYQVISQADIELAGDDIAVGSARAAAAAAADDADDVEQGEVAPNSPTGWSYTIAAPAAPASLAAPVVPVAPTTTTTMAPILVSSAKTLALARLPASLAANVSSITQVRVYRSPR